MTLKQWFYRNVNSSPSYQYDNLSGGERKKKMSFRQWAYRNLYLRSPYWRWLRRQVGSRVGWFCQARGCGVSGHNLDCHHTTYSIMWMEWMFPWLMIYLCREHHTATHSGQVLILRDGKRLKPFGKK